MTEHHKEIHTVAAAEGTPAHKEAGGGSLLEIDGTIIFIAVSFIIFTVVMQRVFYGPLTRVKEKRDQYIKGIKDSADTAFAKAEELSTEYTEKLKTARKKVSENAAKALSDANQEKTRILEERKQQVAEFLEENRRNIQEEEAQSLESLQNNVNSYAADIFRKVLQEDIPVTIGERHE